MSLSQELNKEISIRVGVPGKDAAGGNVTTWSEYSAPWAGIRNLPGTEKRASSHGGGEPIARAEFTIRYDEGVTEAMKILYKGKLYNIRHVNNYNERNERLILTCDTGTSVVG